MICADISGVNLQHNINKNTTDTLFLVKTLVKIEL